MEKVCICITTYNLEKYIAVALDSLLMQRTSFPFKIIVADDCSTDNTLDILHDYERKFKDIVIVLPSNSNMGSLANSNRIFDGLNCEYFSFLDGDDYWTDRDRLQKQVDFLDENKDYVMCAGNTRYLRNGVLEELIVDSNCLNKTYTFDDLLTDKMPFFHTSGILVRNVIFCNGLPSCFIKAVGTFEECALRGEDFRRILHLERGKLYAMKDEFSVYRIHENGLWQGSSNIRKIIETAITSHYYDKYFDGKYGKYFENKAISAYENMIRQLISDNFIYPMLCLSEKDCTLFTSLLVDYSAMNKNTQCRPNINILSKFKRNLLKLF